MNTQSNAFGDSAVSSQSSAARLSPSTRPFYWSLRRELWENRSIYLAPLGVAAVALIGFTISAAAGLWVKPLHLDPGAPQSPDDMAAGLMMLTSMIVGVFYCVDALHSERRDRSILFWKSLPVSDATTVLAKASIPLIVLPLLTSALVIVMQVMMLLIGTLVVAAGGQSSSPLWHQPFLRIWFLVIYHMVTAHALWPAPVYCWLLLVSGWARRAVILWAVLPMVAIAGLEGILFRTWRFAALIMERFFGAAPTVAPSTPEVFPTHPMTHITPGVFLSSPGLWIGLVVAAVFLAAAIRLRRYQGPI